VCPNEFKILKNKWSLKIMRFLNVTSPKKYHLRSCSKNLSGFHNLFMYNAYKWKHLRRSFIELRNMWLGLEGKWRSNWSSDSKLFRWAIDNIYFFLLIFGNFLDQFDKFYALSIIINMFSLSCVKLEHTTKKYFAVCSPEDTRQTNPLQCVVLRPMFLWRRLGVA